MTKCHSQNSTRKCKSPKVIDLFCGVGGLSLGAARAGFEIVGAIDNDKRAIVAHKNNFPGSIHIAADIRKLKANKLLELIGSKREEIEAVIGGPPCQGFSRIGRRDPEDQRNSLFYHFFRIVSEIRPRFFLVENVPGILDSCFKKLRNLAFSQVNGYRIVGPMVLNASDFGAATNRERVLYVGYQRRFYSDIFPCDFISGNASLANVDVQLALTGLRKAINPVWKNEKQGWRSLTVKPRGLFWQKMFGEYPPGVGDQQAIKVLQKKKLVSGCLGTDHTAAVLERFSLLPEGAVDDKSRAIRLRRRGLCPTLRAGTGPEHGSFQALRPIHPTEHRVITPREAARLQGFPDWFQFDHTKWHSFRQIGNSVSPMLSEDILKKILSKRIT